MSLRTLLRGIGAGSAIASGLTRDEIVLILSIVVTVINMVIAFLDKRDNKS